MDDSRKDKSDFAWYYDKLCALQDSCPLPAIKGNLDEDFIDCNADRVKPYDWNPVFDGIRVNSSLRFLALRSYWQPSKSGYDGSAEPRVYTLRKRIPAIKSKDVTYRLCRALQECLTTTNCLECLILQGIPLREGDVAQLTKGILKNNTLKYLSLEYCNIGDVSLQVLSTSIRKSISLTSVNFSGCGLTWRAGEVISTLIKDQGTRRYGEAWQQSLRYRTPDLNNMHGLRRITLNHNTVMGDRSASLLAEALKDDLWVKALDMQQCGITSEGAKAFLAALQLNRIMVVLDLRMNPMIDKELLSLITERVKTNGGLGNPEFPWMSTKRNDVIKSRGQKKGVRFSVTRKVTSRRHTNPQQNLKARDQSMITERSQDDARRHIPWRVQARLEENRGRMKNPLRTVQAFTAMQATEGLSPKSKQTGKLAIKKPRSIGSRKGTRIDVVDTDEDSTHGADIKALCIEIEMMKRRLASEARDRVKCHTRIKELELENRRLKNEIFLLKSKTVEKTSEKVVRENILDDENVLDSIEASFRQFQAFLDLLKASGYNDLNTLLAQAAEQRDPS